MEPSNLLAQYSESFLKLKGPALGKKIKTSQKKIMLRQSPPTSSPPKATDDD